MVLKLWFLTIAFTECYCALSQVFSLLSGKSFRKLMGQSKVVSEINWKLEGLERENNCLLRDKNSKNTLTLSQIEMLNHLNYHLKQIYLLKNKVIYF